MGIEYHSILSEGIPSDSVKSVLSDISCSPRFTLIEQGLFSLKLKFSDPEETSTWPEDIYLEVNCNEVYLLFHYGNLTTIDNCVNEIEEVFENHGIRISFTEV